MSDNDNELPEIRDACEICLGRNGGTPGNENIIDGVVQCDYCTADTLRIERERLRPRES